MRTLILAFLACVAAAADPVPTIRLVTGNPANLVAPGDEGKVALLIANPGATVAQVRLSGTIEEFDGRKAPIAFAGQVPAGGESRIAVPIDRARRGLRTLTWDLDGRPGKASFVYARPAGAGQDPTGFRFSVCSHPNRSPLPDAVREMQAAAQIGIGTMRWGVGWEGLEKKPGEWQWERMDERLAAAEQAGLQTQALLAFCAQHGATAETQRLFAEAVAAKRKDSWLVWNRHAPDDTAWRTYVRTVVARYRQRVAIWEVWNEPDLDGFFKGSTDEYIRMLRSAYEEAKRSDPACQVMTGGFATVTKHPGRRLNPDLEQRVLREAADAFDLHAHHEHGTFPGFVRAVEELERMRAAMPRPRPLYFNETAMHSSFGTDRLQALTLAKKVCWARAAGAIGFTWYDLRNDGEDPADHEHNYGLLTRDFQPKAAYAVYNELIARLRGTRPIGVLDLGPGRHGLVSAGGGRRVALLWNEEPGLPQLIVPLIAPGCTAAAAIDLMGNATGLPVRDGVVLARVGDEPSWIELPGGEAMPRPAAPLVAVEGSTLVAPGESPQLRARLANPTGSPLVLGLSWQGGDGERRARSELAPHGGAAVELDGIRPAPGATAVRIAFAVDGGPWSGHLDIPLRLALRLAAGPPGSRPADWTLDASASVVDFCAADPALTEQTWKGAQDLSARIWLARDGQALRIHAEVRDDIHHQDGDADSAWRGDGLQIGLQVPGWRDYLEIGAALHDDGRILRSIWSCPAGLGLKPEEFEARIVRAGDRTIYDLALPSARAGLDDRALDGGLRFNLIVNDNDGPLRTGFMRVAPGLGERKDPASWPVIRF